MTARQLSDPAAEGAARDTAEKNARVVNSVVNGLTQDALNLAMDIRVDRSNQLDGLSHLVDQMRAMVFPSKKLEAKELYAHGHSK